MADYLLPDVGEGLTEAEIVAWRVKEGDTVQINDIVVEIETAKSLVELPSPYAGVVTGLLVPEGETVPVGTAIISIGDLRLFERLLEEAEDRADLEAARAALAEADDRIPYEEFRRRQGLSDEPTPKKPRASSKAGTKAI